MGNTMIGNKPTSVSAIDDLFKNSMCKGQGQHIINMGKKYGVDPALICGIIMVETGGSPDNGGKNGDHHKNNPMSVLKKTELGFYRYATMEAGIEAGVANLANCSAYSGNIDFNTFSHRYLGGWGGGNLTKWRNTVSNTYSKLTGGNIGEVKFNKGGNIVESTDSKPSGGSSGGDTPTPKDPLTMYERIKKLEEIFNKGDSGHTEGVAELKKVMGYYGDHLPDEYLTILNKYPYYKDYYDKNKAESQLQNQIIFYIGNTKSSKSKTYLAELNKQKSVFETNVKPDDDNAIKYIKLFLEKNKVIPASFFSIVDATVNVKKYLVELEAERVKEFEVVLKSGDEEFIKKYIDKKRELWINYGYSDTPFQYREILAKYGRTANADGRFINRLASQKFPVRHKKKLPNPYVSYVKLSIGEFEFSPIPPEYLLEFSYERLIDSNQGTGNKFSFKLFDKSAMDLEYYIAQGLDEVVFQYGVYGGKESKKFKGKITAYDTDFTTSGSILSIEGISTGLGSFGDPKSESYEGGKPSDIVRKIAKEEDWDIGSIEDTEIVYEDDSKKTPKKFIRTNKDAMTFITSDLVPVSKSNKHKDSNYVCYFEDVYDEKSEEFNSKVFFVSQGWKDDQKKAKENDESGVLDDGGIIIYEFEIGTGPESDVLDFNPQYNGLLTAILGSNEVDVITVNALSNEMFNVKITNSDEEKAKKDSEKKKADEKTADKDGKVTESKSKRIIPIPQTSLDEARKIAASMWYKQANQSYKASMTILGDPTIEPLKFASVLNIPVNDTGLPHHSSGVYVIVKVIDTITENGIFTSELELVRNGLNVSLDDNGRIKVTAMAPPAIGGSDTKSKEGEQPQQTGGSNTAIVAEAEKHIGKRKFVSSFTSGLWCADFTTYCIKQAGQYKLDGTDSSCVGMASLYSKKGKLHKNIDTYNPQPGDAIFFKSSRTSNWTNHVGIVHSATPGPPFDMYTIEGNSGTNFDTTGGKVCKNHYKSRRGNAYISIVAYGSNT